MPSTSTDLSAKLIFPTKEIVEEFYLPIIYTACRTCYSEQVPDQIWDKAVSRQIADEKQQNLVRKVMESGHGSTIEHVNFTFAISGVTRALSHQLVRHRAGTAFDQQSQRYVSFKKRDNYTVPDSIANGDLPDDLAGRFQRGDRREPRPLRAAPAGRGARRGRALHLPERDADEPDHDGQPAPAHPHERAAAVHDGAVGDPPAVQADPPRGLPGQPVLRQLPGAEVRAARLLRRDGQPRRALPHQAAPRHGDGRLGGVPRRRRSRRRMVRSCRRRAPSARSPAACRCRWPTAMCVRRTRASRSARSSDRRETRTGSEAPRAGPQSSNLASGLRRSPRRTPSTTLIAVCSSMA